MKPSINNIRFLAELDSKPLEFIQELKDTNKNLSVLNNKSSNLFHEISGKSSIESFSLSNDGKLKVLKEFIYDLDLNLEANTKTKEEILKLGEKVQFLEELNKDLSFVFYPINSFQEGLKGLLTVIKDKRNKANLSERLFIHLIVSTKNLGEIKVNCQLFGDSFNIRMKIKDENLELFNSTKELLIEKISSLGYSLKGIEFFSNENIGTIDLLSTNVNSVYVLDMKV